MNFFIDVYLVLVVDSKSDHIQLQHSKIFLVGTDLRLDFVPFEMGLLPCLRRHYLGISNLGWSKQLHCCSLKYSLCLVASGPGLGSGLFMSCLGQVSLMSGNWPCLE